MATQLIKLKKPVAGHNADKTINATPAAIAAHQLKLGVDYEPLGTHPGQIKSDLSENPKAATEAKAKAPAKAPPKK